MSNLSPEQFHQTSLNLGHLPVIQPHAPAPPAEGPDDDAFGYDPATDFEDQEGAKGRNGYTSAWDTDPYSFVKNPIPQITHRDENRFADPRLWNSDATPRYRSEWVPTEKIVSTQGKVSPAAIDHQVKHANPLALDQDPGFLPLTNGYYSVTDGNHRVNAAYRRGQLFMPGDVFRPPS